MNVSNVLKRSMAVNDVFVRTDGLGGRFEVTGKASAEAGNNLATNVKKIFEHFQK